MMPNAICYSSRAFDNCARAITMNKAEGAPGSERAELGGVGEELGKCEGRGWCVRVGCAKAGPKER